MIFKSHRKAITDICRHLRHILHVERDVMNPLHAAAISAVAGECDAALAEPKTIDADLFKHLEAKAVVVLEQGVSRHRKSGISDIVDILAVALMVAMGARALFFQPFKIPTGSMQPTLYGIHYMSGQYPDGTPTVHDCGDFLNSVFYGVDRAKAEVPFAAKIRDGSVQNEIQGGALSRLPLIGGWFTSEVTTFALQSCVFMDGMPIQGPHPDVTVTLPGNIDKVAQYLKLGRNARPVPGRLETYGWYNQGEMLADGYLATGDQLFVDRVSHHFTGLKRGDVTVFNTQGIVDDDGIPLEQKGFYYIKRLVGMPGDTLRVRNNRLEVKEKGSDTFVPIEKLAPVFEKLYSDKGGYHGHLPWMELSNGREVVVPEGRYYMMGDNSRSSSDSRYWGTVPRKNIVGRAWFVFWPFSARWGLADGDIAVETASDYGVEDRTTIDQPQWSGRPLPAMSLQ